LAAFAVLLLAGASGAEPAAWKHAEAAARLRICVSSAYAHQVRVDLPEALAATVKGVAAYAPDGSPVPASPLALGDRTPAVWLALGRVSQAAVSPGDDGIPLPIEVYLFTEATIPAPLADAQRRPARMIRTVRALTTRPFRADEALLLLGSMTGSGRPLYAFDTGGIGDTLESAHGEALSERRSAVMFWTSSLALAKPMRAAFGASSVQAAWFLSVDGRPVADWRSVTAEGTDAFWGTAIDLTTGFHSVEYLVIQRHGEAMPQSLWKPDGQQPEALRGHCPTTHPEAVEVQLGPTVPALGVRLAKVSRSLFQDTGVDLLCFTPMAADGKALSEDPLLSLDGQPFRAADGGGSALAAAPHLPRVDLRQAGNAGTPTEVCLPTRTVWVPPTRVAGTCRLLGVPPVVAATEGLPLHAELAFGDDEVDPRLVKQLKVLARQVDRTGKSLAEDVLGTGAGRFSASIALADGAARVLVEVRAGKAVLLPPLPIRVLRSGDDLHGLEAMGQGLYQAGEHVVLACRPMESLTPARERASPSGWRRLGVLDDLCTPVDAPGASLVPERTIGQTWPEPPLVFRETVPDSDQTGALPSVVRFPALVRLLEMRPDAVLLLVGAPDLRHGRSVREISRDLLFLAQAVSAAGAVPIVVALPALPGVPAAESRQAALLFKELAWRLAVPAVDGHSGERLRVLAGGTFADTFATAEGHVALAGPNDHGREWLYGLMDQAVADLRRTRGP